MRKILLGCVLTATLALIPTHAEAQAAIEPNTATLTPFLSTSFGVSEDRSSSLGLGIAVGYDWTRRLGFEFELARVFDVAGDDDDLDWSLTNISGNVLYHFPAGPKITPYATAGLGWERSNVDIDDPDPVALTIPSSTEIAWNFGGGVKYPLNQRIVARADIRRFQVNDLAPDHWRFYGGITFWIKR